MELGCGLCPRRWLVYIQTKEFFTNLNKLEARSTVKRRVPRTTLQLCKRLVKDVSCMFAVKYIHFYVVILFASPLNPCVMGSVDGPLMREGGLKVKNEMKYSFFWHIELI